MISVDAARDLILEQAQSPGVELVDLFSSLGRALAEDVVATRNQPPWDNSAMDGFAVRAIDTERASPDHPVEFEIIEHLPAGYRARSVVGPGQAIHIMTGAPLPSGADAIIRSEETQPCGSNRVRITRSYNAGVDIRRIGEDLRLGEVILTCGTLIRPAEIGLMASTNRSVVSVLRRPRVAILSTGDEIMEIDERATDSQIIDSNSYTLAAMVTEAGCEPYRLGICPDEENALMNRLQYGTFADALITSGGVSVGAYDYVKSTLASMGASMTFWKVAMTPGRPLAFGRIGKTLVFGLPGNPVASMVTFELFVRPALLKMRGLTRWYRPTVQAVLQEDISKASGRKQFFRMRIVEENGQLFTRRTGAQGSAILRSMTVADGLSVTHENQTLLRAGDKVEVMLLGGQWEHAKKPYS